MISQVVVTTQAFHKQQIEQPQHVHVCETRMVLRNCKGPGVWVKKGCLKNKQLFMMSA